MSVDRTSEAYIDYYLKKGYSIKSIREGLRKAGYTEEFINRAIAEVTLNEGVSYDVLDHSIEEPEESKPKVEDQEPKKPGFMVTVVLCIVLLFIFGISFKPAFEETTTGNIVAEPKTELECKFPMIRYGNGCCLDANNNTICDQDDTKMNTTENTCIDENKDGICDDKESDVIGKFNKSEEPNGVESSSYTFPVTSTVGSKEGFFLSIDGFEYELYENWGKLTKINFTLTNEGDHLIKPLVSVNIHDLGTNEVFRPPHIQFDTTLGVGEYIVKRAYVDISFTDLEKPKVLEVTLKDAYTIPQRSLITVTENFYLNITKEDKFEARVR